MKICPGRREGEACDSPSGLYRSILLQQTVKGSRAVQGAIALLKLCIAGRCSSEPHVPLAFKPARRPTLFGLLSICVLW